MTDKTSMPANVKQAILLVEDKNPAGQHLFGQLTESGYTVHIIRDSQSFIGAVRDSSMPVAFVLMNIDLRLNINAARSERLVLRDFTLPVMFLYNMYNISDNSSDPVAEKEVIPCYGYFSAFSGNTILNALAKHSILPSHAFTDVSCARKIPKKERKQNSVDSEKKRYRASFKTTGDGIFVLDSKIGSVIQVNKPLLELLGCSPESMLGHKLWEIKTFASTKQAVKIFQEFHKKCPLRLTDIRLLADDGRTIYVEITTDVYSAEDCKLIECSVRDITDRRRYEKSLEKTISENNQLIAELRQQTENSLGIITNILSMKAMENENGRNRKVLGELIWRIRSLSELNLLLGESRKLSRIQLDVYCGKIIRSVLPSDSRYRVEKSVGALSVTAKQAELTGMILVELLTNVVRHAFSDKESPVIVIRIWRLASRLLMSVEDNGIGIPADAETPRSTGIGLSLVRMMVGQLKGHIKIEKRNGTRVIIQYPLR